MYLLKFFLHYRTETITDEMFACKAIEEVCRKSKM